MAPPPDLRQLVPGNRIQDSLLVLEIEHRDTGTGGFTTLVLGNASGSLPSAPFWAEDQPRIHGLTRGDVAWVVGEIGQYNGKRQIRVGSIRVLPRDSVDWRLLMPSVPDVRPCWDAIDRWRAGFLRPRLASAINLFYDDPDFRRRYQECPASVQGHHACLGGLLQHTCEVAAIGRAIGKACRADVELVVAGALLHDIGKLDAYSWNGAFEHTERGSLLGHVALGLLMLDRRLGDQDPAPCTEREIVLLHHLIASHHGRLEFGATVLPMTLEAEVLHFADNASAKTASMADAVADGDNFAGEALVSAKSLWQLDRRRAYRGKSDWGGKTERPPSRG